MQRCKFHLLSTVIIFSLSLFFYSTAQPKLKGTDLAINGESFFAASNIASELTRLARADGVLPQNESFKQIAVSGASISQILNQYKNCNPKPKYLITDGGGIDMMQSCGGTPTVDCATIKNALNTVRQYIAAMKEGGTKKFIWMRYPDPQGNNWATLRANQDVYNPEVEKICKESKDPVCLWVDLRPVWEGHYQQYTSDGIHCTDAGGKASAEAFWKAMKENNWAFFDTNSTSSFDFFEAPHQSKIPTITYVNERNITLNLFLEKPSIVGVNIFTMAGRCVSTAQYNISSSGSQKIEFPLKKAMAKGIYYCEIQIEKSIPKTATIVIP